MKQSFLLIAALALFQLQPSILAASDATPPASAKLTEDAQAEKLITTLMSGGGSEEIQKLLDEGLDINSRVKGQVSAYQVAILRGETDLAGFLAQHGAITNRAMPAPESLAEILFARFTAANAPGMAALVAQNGKILFEKGYGLADVARGTAITTETKFRIGSITKQFTASTILKLQEQGKLGVNDKLTRFFPDFPRGDEVTLRHLLTHTSGIRSYTDKPGFIEKVTSSISPQDLINSFKNDPYDFSPGEKWHYDNSGYFLLGVIIEKVSGQPYGEFLRKTFFQPLGMTHTGVHRAGIALEHEALGYTYDGAAFTNALNWDMSWAGGAGALYSTVEDLYRWNEATFGGKTLDAVSLKAAWTPVKTEENKDDASESGYGFGWALSRFRGVPEISHGGGLNGFSTFLLRLPDQHFTVAVLANALPGAPGADPGALAHLLTEIYLGETLPPRPITEVNQSISLKALDAIVGRYDYQTGILTVTRDGNRVYAQLGSQPQCEIFPKSETSFFWKVADAQVTFVKDKNGKVVKAIHHQSGAIINAPRLADLKETKLIGADADLILGKYAYGQGTSILTVSRNGDHVFAQLTGQPKFEIFPKSPTEFFWKVVDAQITFVKDSAGKVSKAIHHQGGQVFEVPKIE
jgi:CubicO group peptidase (beta-lactamase class C family)